MRIPTDDITLIYTHAYRYASFFNSHTSTRDSCLFVHSMIIVSYYFFFRYFNFCFLYSVGMHETLEHVN